MPKLEDLSNILNQAAVSLCESGELFEGDETVAIGVDLVHHPLDLLRGDGAECLESVSELRRRDLAIAIGVEALEDPLSGVYVFWGVGGHVEAWGIDVVVTVNKRKKK